MCTRRRMRVREIGKWYTNYTAHEYSTALYVCHMWIEEGWKTRRSHKIEHLLHQQVIWDDCYNAFVLVMGKNWITRKSNCERARDKRSAPRIVSGGGGGHSKWQQNKPKWERMRDNLRRKVNERMILSSMKHIRFRLGPLKHHLECNNSKRNPKKERKPRMLHPVTMSLVSSI